MMDLVLFKNRANLRHNAQITCCSNYLELFLITQKHEFGIALAKV